MTSNNKLKLMRRLHGMLGSENPQERETAHKKLLAALKEHGFTWNDLSAVLRAAEEAECADAAKRATPDAPPPSAARKMMMVALLLTSKTD
jgi:hypothetical protein